MLYFCYIPLKGIWFFSGKQLFIYMWTFLFLSSFEAALNDLYCRDNLAHFSVVDLLESLIYTPLLNEFSLLWLENTRILLSSVWARKIVYARDLWYVFLRGCSCLALWGFILCTCSVLSKVLCANFWNSFSAKLPSLVYCVLHVLMALVSPNFNLLSTNDICLLLEFSFPASLSRNCLVTEESPCSFMHFRSSQSRTACCPVSKNTRSRKPYVVCYHCIKKVSIHLCVCVCVWIYIIKFSENILL